MEMNEALQIALENGILDLQSIQSQVEMYERNRYLNMHTYRFWHGNDGKWYTYLFDETKANNRRLVKRNTKTELEHAVISFYKNREEEPTLDEVFYLWANEKLRFGEIQQQTFDRYLKDYERFIKSSNLASRKIRYITEDDLRVFVKTTIHDMNLTAKAWSGLRLILTGMFRYAKEHKFATFSITNFFGDLNISNRVFKKREIRPEQLVFTNNEVERIFRYVEFEDMSIITLGILFAFQTGLRPGELAALRWSDIIDNKVVVVSKTEVRYRSPETNKWVCEVRESPKTDAGNRNVILPKTALSTLAMIAKYSNNTKDGYMFVKCGKRCTTKAFTNKLYRICDTLNIPRRSFNKSRKTYATKLINANVPEAIIISQMGHVDISTTRKFYYYNNIGFDETKQILDGALSIQ